MLGEIIVRELNLRQQVKDSDLGERAEESLHLLNQNLHVQRISFYQVNDTLTQKYLHWL